MGFREGSPEAADFDSPTGRVVRCGTLNVALYLECHARRGFVDVLMGALSITISAGWTPCSPKTKRTCIRRTGFCFLVTIVLFTCALVTGRINKLAAAMKSFPDNAPRPEMLPTGQDEIADLGNHFNHLCQRLTQSWEELEKNRAQACFNEKMASLGILSAGIAHEVNNPLAGMLNCVKAMGENPDNDELHRRYLPLINKGLRQIEQTMRQLLNFGRTEPLQQRQVDAAALIRECFELLSCKLKEIHLNIRSISP